MAALPEWTRKSSLKTARRLSGRRLVPRRFNRPAAAVAADRTLFSSSSQYIYIYIYIHTRTYEHIYRRRREHEAAAGLIDRPLFLPGRPQKLKTAGRETRCRRRRSMVFPEFSHQHAHLSNDVGTYYASTHARTRRTVAVIVNSSSGNTPQYTYTAYGSRMVLWRLYSGE